MYFRSCSIDGILYHMAADGQRLRWCVSHCVSPNHRTLHPVPAPSLLLANPLPHPPSRDLAHTSALEPIETAEHALLFDSFFLALALCNTVRVEKDTVAAQGAQRLYLASSPDEEALVKAAAASSAGHALLDRTQTSLTLSIKGNETSFELVGSPICSCPQRIALAVHPGSHPLCASCT